MCNLVYTNFLTQTYPPVHTHTHTLSLSLTHTHTHIHTRSLSLSHTHTHIHTHSLSHTHTLHEQAITDSFNSNASRLHVHFTNAEVYIAVAIYAIGGMTGALTGGFIADHIGRYTLTRHT